jgi:signal peptidase I
LKERLKKLYDFSNSWTGTIIIVLLVIFFVAQAFVIPSGSMKRTLLIGDHLFVKKFAYGIPVPHIPWLEWPVLPDFRGDGHIIEGDKPKRGDIVVFRYPKNIKVHYVKRCVATGGDEIIFQEKKLYIHFKEGDEWIKKHYPPTRIYKIVGKLWVLNPYMLKYPGIQYDENVNLFREMLLYLSAGQFAMQPMMLNELPKYQDLMINAFYFKVPQGRYFMMGDNRDHSNDSRFWGSVPYRDIVGKPWFVYFSWDKNYKIRWNRIGRTVNELSLNKKFIDKSVSLK